MRAYCLPVKLAADSRVATSLRLAAVPFYATAALGVAIALWSSPRWSLLCVLVGVLALTQTARALGLRWPALRQLRRGPSRWLDAAGQLHCVAVLEHRAGESPFGTRNCGKVCDWPRASRLPQPIGTHDCRAAPPDCEDPRIHSRGGSKSRSVAITPVSGRGRCRGRDGLIDVVPNRAGAADSNRRRRVSDFSAAQRHACHLRELSGNLLRSIAQLERSARQLHKMTEKVERLRPVQFDQRRAEHGIHSVPRRPEAHPGPLGSPNESLCRSTVPPCPRIANALGSPRNLSDLTSRDARNGPRWAAQSRGRGSPTGSGESIPSAASARTGSLAGSARAPKS